LKKKIGITGGIASGKSVVARILSSIGYPVFYSDTVAKELVNSDPFLKSQLIKLLGADTYSENKLNRKFVADKVFADQNLLTELNALIHPAVRKKFDEWCSEQQSDIVFNEAAILFETDSYKRMDATILVVAPEETRISRAIQRDDASREDILNRMNKQWPDDKKISLADYVVLNDENHPVIKQLEKIISELVH
jgi:dephospho-CoA kinase